MAWLDACLLLVIYLIYAESAATGSMVLSTEPSDSAKQFSEGKDLPISKIPEIYDLNIRTNVTNRYAKTLITSKVRNRRLEAQEAVFFVVLPEKAFISEFIMEIGGKSYKAYVKEKGEAKRIYNKAVQRGQNAAHVSVSARDSNKFTVSLNIGPQSKAVFMLTYEELLERKKGKYEIVLNIHPGQVVPKLDVEVRIDETAPLSFVRTPSLRTGNEINKNGDLKPNAEIIETSATSAIVKFHPDSGEQKKIANSLKTKESDGVKGQFVVEYDVQRNKSGGEVLLNDGYFVHFLAPEHLEALPTHVVFVLDLSGSMEGNKIHQLIDAMVHIFDDLKSQDTFSIVTFSTSVQIWDKESNRFIDLKLGFDSNYGHLEEALKDEDVPKPIKATAENIAKAKSSVKNIRLGALTNIFGGLEVGLNIIKRAQKNDTKYYQPLLIFLTDGDANVGISTDDVMVRTIAKLNPKDSQTPIFSLSFGEAANKGFLRKLSFHNSGFSRHIYEESDASLQLQDFYKYISSPLLKNIVFKYTEQTTFTTRHNFPIYFGGSELIVAGKISPDPKSEYIVEGWRPGGTIELKPKVIELTNSLERLWAFLTVRQLLTEMETSSNKMELTKKAVELALKYSFVTSVTSLVVVKPNETSAVNAEKINSKGSTVDYGDKDDDDDDALNFNSGHTQVLQNRLYSKSMHNYFGGHSTFPLSYPSMRSGMLSLPRLRSSATMGPPPIILPVPLPELQKQGWFKLLMKDPFSIKISKEYKLASYGTVVLNQSCNQTVSNKTGNCVLLHKCPKAVPFLTDLGSFMKVFCALGDYAGICCDV